jgi:hypothetical protein
VKTISLKKVSAVAVASLGFGLLSVVPANAAALGITSTGVATAPTVATTIATPASAGSAITVTLNTVLADAATAAGNSITATYSLLDPNGTAVTSDATFTSAAAAVGGVTPSNAANVYTLAIGNGAAAATKAYAILNCRGVVRIDFIYNEAQQKPYMLEVNTVPGQSDASVIPQQVRAMGWSLTDFYGAIIEDTLSK